MKRLIFFLLLSMPFVARGSDETDAIKELIAFFASLQKEFSSHNRSQMAGIVDKISNNTRLIAIKLDGFKKEDISVSIARVSQNSYQLIVTAQKENHSSNNPNEEFITQSSQSYGFPIDKTHDLSRFEMAWKKETLMIRIPLHHKHTTQSAISETPNPADSIVHLEEVED